jgi:hypothetical protein
MSKYSVHVSTLGSPRITWDAWIAEGQPLPRVGEFVRLGAPPGIGPVKQSDHRVVSITHDFYHHKIYVEVEQ